MQERFGFASGPLTEGFPDDDKLWLIKYIDQFDIGAAGNESTTVHVMLQRLPINDPTHLKKLTTREIQQLLGVKPKSSHEFRFVQQLVGNLPALSIGNVYQAKYQVGSLTSNNLSRLFLKPGQSIFREVQAGERIPAPAWWDSSNSHRVLNLSEYSGIAHHRDVNVDFSKSRLLVYDRHFEDGSIDTFILPRMTIFKAFFASHTALANAFSDGPWFDKARSLLVLDETYGGLKTGIADNGQQWNVILQNGIQQEYAGLLAALYFDDYARSCAESIYSMALVDRQRNRLNRFHYASAEIPFEAKSEALTLAFKSLELKPQVVRTISGQRPLHRKFLITEICGFTWPSYFPRIGRVARSQRADDTEIAQLAPPYFGSLASKQGDENTVLRSDLDANDSLSTTELSGENWSWLGKGPQYVKLEKERSLQYERGFQRIDTDGTQVSAGVKTNKKNALPKAELKSVVREHNAGYAHMFDLFVGLNRNHTISNLAVIPARHEGQRTSRGDFECWRFIDDKSVRSISKPLAEFACINEKPGDRRTRYSRSALVLQFLHQGHVHYWIEIERVRTDKFKSVMLTIDDKLDRDYYIEATLNSINQAQGKHLKTRLPISLPPGYVRVSSYKHIYKNGEVSIESLLTHLKTHTDAIR